MSDLLDSLLGAFDTLPLRDAGGLAVVRRAALDAVGEQGLPPARAERWKYTSLRALERRRFSPSLSVPMFEAAALALPPAPRLVFVNGILDAAHSDPSGLASGVTLVPLSRALAADDAHALAFLARRYERSDETFARLNTALANEGAVLRVEAGVKVDLPVHLVFVGVPDSDRAWHLRHLIELREHAALTLVEHRFATGAHAHLANELTHVHLARGAKLTHARVQAEADGATLLSRSDALLADAADYRRVDLELGAALSRHEFNAALQGAQARLHANGVLLAAGRRHLDTRMAIEHVARESDCHLAWRGLGADRGRVVFHGGIVIRSGADGSEAALANKNLLLSPGAEIDTQPVLEIHADEVKAAHGATVGRLDDNALFYLRSRGLPQSQARALLTAAFCGEVLGVLQQPMLIDALRTELDTALSTLECV